MTPPVPSPKTVASFPGMIAFFTASVVSGLVTAAAGMTLLHPDETGLPGGFELAYQAAFIGLIFSSAAGTAILGVSALALGARIGERPARAQCIGAGAAYPVTLFVFGLVLEFLVPRDSLAFLALGWAMLAAFPIATAALIARRQRGVHGAA